MEKYYPPMHHENQFHCIHCGVYSAQHWRTFFLRTDNGSYAFYQPMEYCVCQHCSNWSFWYEGHMIVPYDAPVPPAHVDMPADCLADYAEARAIVAVSPRAASALLRLAVQKLVSVLGEKGESIEDDIDSLVAKGLPVQVQHALDFCRVVGNNAVHPGEINIEDTPEIAHSLFEMMNYIVEDRISRPKQFQVLYDKLPEAARKAIDKTDAS